MTERDAIDRINRRSVFPITERTALSILVFVLASWALVRCGTAAAKAQPPSDGRMTAAHELARTALHEGALENIGDTALIWQCAETNATTMAGRIAWLRRHSPRATGVVPALPFDTNAWTARFDFAHVPDGFAERDYFRVVTLPRARAVLAFAKRLVSGEDTRRPCDVPPRSWDGRKFDHARAARDGLYPIGCKGTLNDGFATKADIAKVRG